MRSEAVENSIRLTCSSCFNASGGRSRGQRHFANISLKEGLDQPRFVLAGE